jgi:hypothetical protein
MGFRDFHSFNLAMLAKQFLRLINESNSLCARVLSAKYYPQGDILQDGPKSGSSFTWQSIVADLATTRGNSDYTKVSEFINPSTEQWDEELNNGMRSSFDRSIFDTVDANRVM